MIAREQRTDQQRRDQLRPGGPPRPTLVSHASGIRPVAAAIAPRTRSAPATPPRYVEPASTPRTGREPIIGLAAGLGPAPPRETSNAPTLNHRSTPRTVEREVEYLRRLEHPQRPPVGHGGAGKTACSRHAGTAGAITRCTIEEGTPSPNTIRETRKGLRLARMAPASGGRQGHVLGRTGLRAFHRRTPTEIRAAEQCAGRVGRRRRPVQTEVSVGVAVEGVAEGYPRQQDRPERAPSRPRSSRSSPRSAPRGTRWITDREGKSSGRGRRLHKKADLYQGGPIAEGDAGRDLADVDGPTREADGGGHRVRRRAIREVSRRGRTLRGGRSSRAKSRA